MVDGRRVHGQRCLLRVPLELSEIGGADQFYQPLFLVRISIPGFPCHNLMNSAFSINSLIFSGPNKFTTSPLSCHLDFLPCSDGRTVFLLKIQSSLCGLDPVPSCLLGFLSSVLFLNLSS